MEAEYQSTTFTIRGMTCPSCLQHAQHALLSLEGVQAVTINNWRNGETQLVAPVAVSRGDITQALAAFGYTIANGE